jgi:hypothetical protein
MLEDFASGVFIGWSGVHLDMASNRIMSVAGERDCQQDEKNNTICGAHHYKPTQIT